MEHENHTSHTGGLTSAEVQARIRNGLVNGTEDIQTKSTKRIIFENTINPFNILNLILGALVLFVGSFKNALFLGVMLCNTFIGCFQEIRAKKTIDQLSLIASPKAVVIRDGKKQKIEISKIVLDDLMVLSSGNQICSDSVVISGECEVNESLITGESDPIIKQPGDHLLSGSFLVSGTCQAQVEHIGKDNYAAKITSSAKYIKKPNSEIMQSINLLIKIIGFILFPVGFALFYKQVFISNIDFGESIISTVAALIGMIPEGLVLLTSVVLAVGIIRLSHKHALVQELYSIETLARVDTLCLDKTGTITEGTMQVDEFAPFNNEETELLKDAASAVIHTLNDANPTSTAISEFCSQPPSWDPIISVPFSSARKWSGVSFAEHGTYVLGAGEFVLGSRFSEIRSQVEKASQKGQRVLVLAHSEKPICDQTLPEDIAPKALFMISDRIRKSANNTLQYFADQGVDLKVISGDNAITVSKIAQKAGLKNADQWVDATTLKSENDVREAAAKYTVFGRVTPQQKLQLVQSLKGNGHTVAMTGDGVNDVLALKESDCSIAMASGSDAARTVSQIVLMDSDFASMPSIVAEGRRSINNLQRSSSLFLVKSFFSTIIAICFIFLQTTYPFEPIQFTLINALTIGIPSFFLALEPNKERIHGKFILNIIKKSIPGAITMAANILLLVPCAAFLGLDAGQLSTLCVMLTCYTGLMNLFKVCFPFNALHTILFSLMCVGFLIAQIYFQPLFSLVPFTIPMILLLIPLLSCATAMMILLSHLIDRIIMRPHKKAHKHKAIH